MLQLKIYVNQFVIASNSAAILFIRGMFNKITTLSLAMTALHNSP